jgi:hypothetical protein
MLKRTCTSLLTLAAIAAAAPGSAAAAVDTVVVPGVEATRMTALDGTLVWVTGKFPRQTLMQRATDGAVAPVQGAPVATYRSLDLGRDGSGRLVLTYVRCAGTRDCKAYSDDLAGHRVTYKRLAPAGCSVTAAPARWGSRVAYGLACTKRSGSRRVADPARTGLFVRKGSAAAKRLRLPKDAVKFHIDSVSWVDLRGTVVGAAVSDVYSYAFTQTVNATGLRSDLVAASEGDSDEHVVGQALGSGGTLWTLVDAIHAGDPNTATISRVLGGDCDEYERLVNAPGPRAEGEDFRAEAMAVDGATIYLYAPDSGIVTHEFVPFRPCT